MTANPHDPMLTKAATLIARQEAVVSRCKALGWNEALAESLLAEMRRSERLTRGSAGYSRAAHAHAGLDTTFLSSVAHDFRNQLQSLKLDMHGAEAGNHPEDIAGGLSMLSLLSHDLLIASRMQNRELRLRACSHSVARLLDEVATVVAPIARLSGVHLHVVPAPGALRIRCDWERTLHATATLAVEIAKVTRRGGNVSICARRSLDRVRFVLVGDSMPARPRRAMAVRVGMATALIEAQGGHVWSGKPVGRDNHLCFSMPSHP